MKNSREKKNKFLKDISEQKVRILWKKDHTRFQKIKKCMNYYKDLPRNVVAEKKRKGKHILYIFSKSCHIIIIFITTIELFIKKKKRLTI